MKICRENPNLVQIGQKYLALYVNTSVYFTVAATLYHPKSAPSTDIVSGF